jgi:hypothetical protein
MTDRRWRLNNLYVIIDKDGRRIDFRLNWAQEELLDALHFQNVILKARQLGFTTFIQLFMLDACLFNSNIRAGTIAHKLDDAKTIFRDKVKYPYENLPEALRAARPIQKDSADELLFSNNSSIRVGTSMRSGTLQYLHISEYGKLCAQFPDKAREVRTGALNTVQAGQVVFLESTAEGKEGHFYELSEGAQAKRRMSSPLTPLDFKFHFFPWWRAPEYELNPTGVIIPEPQRKYFETLEATHGIVLPPAKQSWYITTRRHETRVSLDTGGSIRSRGRGRLLRRTPRRRRTAGAHCSLPGIRGPSGAHRMGYRPPRLHRDLVLAAPAPADSRGGLPAEYRRGHAVLRRRVPQALRSPRLAAQGRS